ncbi:PIN domain-containing protein [Candidatus Gottesmanbacteria bacterium]|nr:PIN domain-containing protein [Candidatus Gottesmanbacteria bacterium]
MKKIFLDSNIWLRYLLRDEEKQFRDCQQLLILNEQGKFKIYTSTICLLEIVYTLSSFYKIKRDEVVADLRNIISTRNLTLIDKTNFSEALRVFEKHQIKFADCLIATQIPKGVILCTYDREFKKIKTFIALTPSEYFTR